MGIKTIQLALKKYIRSVGKHVRVEKALVYGSYAKKRQGGIHDVDVLVLSDDFASMDADDRSKLLYRASLGFPYDLHVYGVTPSEWKHASSLTTLGQIRHAPMLSIV